ncbi:MAG: hypothetical protein ACFFBJ_09095 [Promethearchaeota archaeon]
MTNDGPSSGFFVTLYDEDTLNLYLDQGIYGFLMKPEYDNIGKHSRHYAALADYACGRKGTHVFFFLKRKIVYGGQLVGSERHGCFYMNGPLSPMGIKAGAELQWDESQRECYQRTDREGVFRVKTADGLKERCQPYLIRFQDDLGFKGRRVTSDDLYDKLGSFRYPLPSNTIQGMGFCTLTPGECEILLELYGKTEGSQIVGSKEDVALTGEPTPFEPEYGISKSSEAKNESHLEASVAANPSLFPSRMAPKGAAICRQVPVSPLKPYQMDRADICYYASNRIEDGTLPNVVIELKNIKAGKKEVNQVVRYIEWLKRVVPSKYQDIEFYLYAPDFASNVMNYIPSEFRSQMEPVTFDDQEENDIQLTLS